MHVFIVKIGKNSNENFTGSGKLYLTSFPVPISLPRRLTNRQFTTTVLSNLFHVFAISQINSQRRTNRPRWRDKTTPPTDCPWVSANATDSTYYVTVIDRTTCIILGQPGDTRPTFLCCSSYNLQFVNSKKNITLRRIRSQWHDMSSFRVKCSTFHCATFVTNHGPTRSHKDRQQQRSKLVFFCLSLLPVIISHYFQIFQLCASHQQAV